MSKMFDDAVRRMLGAPPGSNVSSWMSNSDFHGCDTCGHGASPPTVTVAARSMRPHFYNQREFDSMPELWDALVPDDESDS